MLGRLCALLAIWLNLLKRKALSLVGLGKGRAPDEPLLPTSASAARRGQSPSKHHQFGSPTSVRDDWTDWSESTQEEIKEPVVDKAKRIQEAKLDNFLAALEPVRVETRKLTVRPGGSTAGRAARNTAGSSRMGVLAADDVSLNPELEDWDDGGWGDEDGLDMEDDLRSASKDARRQRREERKRQHELLAAERKRQHTAPKRLGHKAGALS